MWLQWIVYGILSALAVGLVVGWMLSSNSPYAPPPAPAPEEEEKLRRHIAG